MHHHYYKTPDGQGNFGDELNVFIWDKFLPGFFDDNKAEVFFGIGTILRASKNYPGAKIIVFGSGAPNSQLRKDYSFKFYFVRGPLTAKHFDLSDNVSITDPAILTPIVFPKASALKEFQFGYMPHWTVDNKQYKKLVESLGILYISPKEDVTDVINKLNKCNVMICEAMHAAIVSDAYRIPWIPVSTFKSFNRFKWEDWSKSMLLDLNIIKLPRLYEEASWMSKKIRGFLFRKKLKALLKVNPFLSSNEVFKMRNEQIMQQITKLKSDYNIT